MTKAQRRAKARALEVAAWSLYCEGHSMPEIAAQHHVTRQPVHKAIKRAIARAMDGLTGNIREQKAAQVARLERIAELAMESFRKSCRDRNGIRQVVAAADFRGASRLALTA